MKKVLCLILALVVCIGCSSCSPKNDFIEVKGLFFLDPQKIEKWDEENLDENISYFFVVYDLKNNTSKNQELYSSDSSIMLELNDVNKYEQLDPGYSNIYLKDFVEYSGYSISTDDITLYGGSNDTMRMIAAFEINMNDINDKTNGELRFDISNDIEAKIEFSKEDVKTINVLDEIFSIEDNYDNYQIARSAIKRACYSRSLINSLVLAYNSKNINDMTYAAAMMNVIFSAETTYGFSAGGFGNDDIIPDDTLPRFNIEAVNTLYPDIASDFKELITNLNSIYECLADDNMTISKLDRNALQQYSENARENIDNIKEYFDIN